MLPLKGFSILSSPGNRFHDESLDLHFVERIKQGAPDHVRVECLDCGINDPMFSSRAVEMLLEMIVRRWTGNDFKCVTHERRSKNSVLRPQCSRIPCVASRSFRDPHRQSLEEIVLPLSATCEGSLQASAPSSVRVQAQGYRPSLKRRGAPT